MLSPKFIIIALSLLSTFALNHRAKAGLYGFDNITPYTQDENILHMDYLPEHIPNYRALMRDNLLMLMDYARSHNPNFQIIAHEGQVLLAKSRWEYDLEGYNQVRRKETGTKDPYFLIDNKIARNHPAEGTPAYQYLHGINAIVLNNLYCGKGQEEDLTINHNLGLISIENCPNEQMLDQAIMRSLLDNKIIYGFSNLKSAFKDLNSQPLINDSASNIYQVSQAKNITFLLNDKNYNSKEEILNEIASSNYDIVIINPIFQHSQPFSIEDINRIKLKKNGARRLIIAEINVSEASTTDYFWNPRWKLNNPSWLVRKSFVSQNSYITRYWDEEWKKIISRYFKDIVRSGYDGAFFTGIENHQYFEHETPLE